MVFHGDSWIFHRNFIGAALLKGVKILSFWKKCKLCVPIDLYCFELGHHCEFLLGQSCCWGWMGELCTGNVTGICWIDGKSPCLWHPWVQEWAHTSVPRSWLCSCSTISESQFHFQWEKYFFHMASCSHQGRSCEGLTWCFWAPLLPFGNAVIFSPVFMFQWKWWRNCVLANRGLQKTWFDYSRAFYFLFAPSYGKLIRKFKLFSWTLPSYPCNYLSTLGNNPFLYEISLLTGWIY